MLLWYETNLHAVDSKQSPAAELARNSGQQKLADDLDQAA